MEGINWSLPWWHPHRIAHPYDRNKPPAEITVKGVTYILHDAATINN
jgi:hypothetical protein